MSKKKVTVSTARKVRTTDLGRPVAEAFEKIHLPTTRRDFLKTSATAAAAVGVTSALGISAFAEEGDDTLDSGRDSKMVAMAICQWRC